MHCIHKIFANITKSLGNRCSQNLKHNKKKKYTNNVACQKTAIKTNLKWVETASCETEAS